ncbi:pentatricopeptide repeat-containing protein At2g20540 [Morus notabilis]|nr:pentatricopeptide repeat-containing protein At2g20540 [Morus notabilis]
MSAYSTTRRCLLLLEKCKNMQDLKKSHALVLTTGLGTNTFALSRLLAFCSDPHRGSPFHAWKIFQNIQQPTICIWNTVLKAFLLNDELIQTINIYKEMLHSSNIAPDNYTLPYVLKACSRLQSACLGVSVHGHGLKSGLAFDLFVGNSLIVMYSEFRNMEAARQVFDEMPSLSTVSWMVMISGYGKVGEVDKERLFFDLAPVRDRGIWGAMISGYVQNACFKEGLYLFRLMQCAEIEPDEAIFVSVLCGCAHLGALDVGVWIHRYLDRLGLPLSVRLGTGLVDMYAKCGNLDLARMVFEKMPQKDTVCWNAMISAMAMHGDGDTAFELFEEMEEAGVRPDDITFIAILTACSYSGRAYEGMRMLDRMCRVYQIEPKSEHYGCIVDLLSRAGLFEEASKMIQRLATSSNRSEEEMAWRAFLSACCKHGQSQLAEFAPENLSQSEHESGFYVLLSNLYASAGKGCDAGKVRNLMKNRGIEKVPGCSSVQIDVTVHEFIAGEKIHPQMKEIHLVLEKINKHLYYPECKPY